MKHPSAKRGDRQSAATKVSAQVPTSRTQHNGDTRRRSEIKPELAKVTTVQPAEERLNDGESSSFTARGGIVAQGLSSL